VLRNTEAVEANTQFEGNFHIHVSSLLSKWVLSFISVMIFEALLMFFVGQWDTIKVGMNKKWKKFTKHFHYNIYSCLEDVAIYV